MLPAHPPTAFLPSFGHRLKRLRRSKGLKQSAIATLAGVNQATVSRWEAGGLLPSADTMQGLLDALAGAPAHDAALQRLVQHSAQPTHLVTDVDHRLLAASLPRQRVWGVPLQGLLQTSLWRFATDDIAAAEAALTACGWWDDAAPRPVTVQLRSTQTEGLHIRAGTMLWERVWLASGEPARLCTTLPDGLIPA